MEPMALGSPVGSPAPAGPTSPYLPQFLMGESELMSHSLNQSLSQSHAGGGSTWQPFLSPTSPSRAAGHVSFASPPVSNFGTPLGPADARINRGPTATGLLTQSEKGSGPPTTGLFDTLRPSAQSAQLFSPPKTHDTSVFEANLNASLRATSPQSSRQQPQWYTGEALASNWVTVFGFPTSGTSSILAQFARYGNIIDKQLPVQGNWMHLQYQTRVEVRRALGNNGKIFGGNTMIGVMPCTDPAVVGDGCKENAGGRDFNITRMSLATAGNMSFGTPLAGTPGPSVTSPLGTPRSARPLQKAFSSVHLSSDVVSPQNTPQRSTSFVSRAMDYVFNW